MEQYHNGKGKIMSNQIAAKLQTKFSSFMVSLGYLVPEVSDIEKAYFAGPSAQLAGLADGDPATVSTKLTKLEISNAIGLCQQINNFFQNAAVTQGDYLAVIEPVLYGNDQATTAISVEVEAIGERLYLLCQTVLELFKNSKDNYTTYWANEIGNAVGAIATGTVFYGIGATAGDLVSAITITEQFKKMINNEAVATSDYKSIIAKWQRLA